MAVTDSCKDRCSDPTCLYRTIRASIVFRLEEILLQLSREQLHLDFLLLMDGCQPLLSLLLSFKLPPARSEHFDFLASLLPHLARSLAMNEGVRP